MSPSPRLSMLTAEDKQVIHARALEILEKVGIRFHSEKVCRILQEAGCEVDWSKLSAKISRSLVEAGLETLPSRFTLAAPDPDKNIDVGSGTPWYTSGGQSPWFKDLETGRRRPSTSADLVQCAHLIDALDEVEEWCPMVVPGDVAPELMGLKVMEVSLLHGRKHFVGGTEPASARFVGELFDAVLGDRKILRERPIWSFNQTPISPLQNDGKAVEQVLSWADYQVPILLTFLPLSGATAPVTLEGTVLQETANFLGNMAFYQLVSPGWPMIWSASAGIVDMRSIRWSGIVEPVLMSLALAELAKTLYHVPVSAYGEGGGQSKAIDFLSGLEAVFSDSVLGLAGVDNIWGIADLDGATYVDLDYVVLGTQAIRLTKRLRRGLTIDDDHLLTEVILEQGFEADYLAHPTTARRFRKEHLLADLFPCVSYEDWEGVGKSDTDLARERLNEILGEHEPIQHPPEVLKEVERVMRAAEKELLENKRSG